MQEIFLNLVAILTILSPVWAWILYLSYSGCHNQAQITMRYTWGTLSLSTLIITLLHV